MDFKVSYESQELIEQVVEDIILFGESFKVFALFKFFGEVDGRYYGRYFIVDYVYSDKPYREEAETEEEYKTLLDEYYKGIAEAGKHRNEELSLEELLEKLIEQDRIL